MTSEEKYERSIDNFTNREHSNRSRLPEIQQVGATHASITLQWEKDKSTSSKFQYSIKYRNEDETGKWKIALVDSDQNQFEITRLQPNASYKVIVNQEYNSGETVRLYEITAKTKPSIAEKLLPHAQEPEQTTHCMPIYRMKPIREELTTKAKDVKCVTFIEKENDMDRMVNKEKNIMLVGCTGTGKTTLVDALFNYLAGVSINDDFRLKITDEQEDEDQTKSQTDTTTCYSLPNVECLSNQCSLNIIDTPGFNDTDDKDFHMKIVKQVKALLTTRISTLDAICIVSPLSSFRLTEAQKSVFNGIFELFGHDVNDIIYCLCTFDDGGKEHVLKAFKDEEIKLKAHFKFSNSDLFEKISDDKHDTASKRWLTNSFNFKPFLNSIYKSEGKSVRLTRDVLNHVENLEIQLTGLRYNVRKSAQNVINLRQEFKLLKDNKEKMKRGEHFEYYETQSKTFYKRTSNNKKSMNCNTCERTCHESCWAIIGVVYWTCKVFKSSECTLCKCSTDEHINESAIYKEEFEEVLKTDEDLKKKFASAEEAKLKLKDELRALDMVIKRIKTCIKELKDKALRYNNLTINDYIAKLHTEELSRRESGYKDREKIYDLLQKDIECHEPAMRLLD